MVLKGSKTRSKKHETSAQNVVAGQRRECQIPRMADYPEAVQGIHLRTNPVLSCLGTHVSLMSIKSQL